MTSVFWSLLFGTFVLEDVALVTGIALAAQGKISLPLSFTACFLGIAVGDLALYFLGALALRFKLISETKWFLKLRQRFGAVESESWMSTAVFGCRFIPGTRIPTFTLAGFVRYPFSKFLIITIVSVLLWVWVAFQIGFSARAFFADHLVLAIISLFGAIGTVRFLIKNLRDEWPRRAFLHAWRKWASFEFWPPWLFYLPIVPRYIFLSLKYRSFVLPFYANPFLEHAGLIGESKWDIFKYLLQDQFSLRTRLVKNGSGQFGEIMSLVQSKEFYFPFIVKPDKGQRGFAVRIIHDPAELENYLAVADFDLILQEFCDWNFEAGVFYYRMPDESHGKIFSITDKQFPWIVGDGEKKLGQLILEDRRARIIAPTYFERFHGKLDTIPAAGEKVVLSTCGNHCQGAIFKNGLALNSPELLNSVETVVSQIPDFYFGRLDIRYHTPGELLGGQAFKIVEINGAGSEATHIWDPATTLAEAYRVLYAQWGILFEIGSQVKQRHLIRYEFNFLKFVNEVFKLSKQEKKLAVSS